MKSLGILICSVVSVGASLAVAQGSAPARSVFVNPDWLKKPTPEQVTSAWPREALLKGKNGRAELSCQVNIQGLLEGCVVSEEEPAGFGFGAAALTLTPQFQFRPATRDGAPMPSKVNIPINFKSNGPVQSESLQSISIITHPIWKSAPTFGELGAVYPKAGGGVAGYVAYRCHVKSDGGLQFCDVIDENPKGRGFVGAAHSLLKSFTVEITEALSKSPNKLIVDVPIRLVDPKTDEFTSRRIGEPIWLTQIDSARSTGLFPSAAGSQGVHAGRGTAKCVISAAGDLVNCTPGPADPPNVGFSEAAVRVVQVMRMNRWTAAGGPIDGATVTIPVRLEDQHAATR